MAGLIKAGLKNPPAAGAVIGAVVGLVLGVIVDYLLFHHGSLVRAVVIGAALGGAAGWWQHKAIAKFLLQRISPV